MSARLNRTLGSLDLVKMGKREDEGGAPGGREGTIKDEILKHGYERNRVCSTDIPSGVPSRERAQDGTFQNRWAKGNTWQR